MEYLDLVKEDATDADICKYLSQGDQVAITIRIPENLKEASKEFASLKGMSFSAMIRAGLIQQLLKKDL